MRPFGGSPKYDGPTRAGIESADEREAIYIRDGGRCQTCLEAVPFDGFELAHRIANTKANRRRWGNRVVDSPQNRCVTHPGRCNSRQNIGGNPAACLALANKISPENT
jgi:hypothetical protein